jgi:hypothetical protein
MRQLLTFALILVFAGTAFGADLGNTNGPASIKDDSHVLQNPTMGRDGGDDSSSAVAISGLPFSDTGSTGGSSDAWDEACPYTGSTSPDKWYSFTPAADMSVFVDLCGSLYDTKTYILDAGMAVVACNDDFYFGSDPCGSYVSKIESAALMGGATYYIVVDGYGGDFGDYVLEVGEFTPCLVPCDGVAEGEPALVDGYVDNFNGGCNTDPNSGPFQELVADEYGNLTFCGVGGWYMSSDGSQYRDTDWFLATIGSTGTVTWTLESEQNAYGFLLAPQDCPNVAVAEQVLASCGNPQVMVITGNPGDVVWLWVGSDVFSSPNGLPEFGYRSDFTGLAEGPIATDATSFDGIKAMYR